MFFIVIMSLVTIKSYGQLSLAWSNSYWSAPNTGVIARDIVFDKDGYSYVAGVTYTSNVSGHHISLLKYDRDGNEIWSIKYLHSTSYKSDAFAIELDDSNNVYVAGATDIGWLVLKFDSNGKLRWNKEHIINQNRSAAYDLEVTNAGQVYVAGGNIFGQYALAKYDRNGEKLWLIEDTETSIGWSSDPLWVQMALTNKGDLYITTTGEGNLYNYMQTIKYNSSGVKQWEQNYHSNHGLGAFGGRIEIFPSGDICVLGNGGLSGILFKYGTDGKLKWSYGDNINQLKYFSGSPSDMVIDKSGNISIVGTLNSQDSETSKILTTKFNSQGNPLWQKTFRSGSRMIGEAIVLDDFGNSYVIGSGMDSIYRLSYRNITLIKYDATGNEVWTKNILGHEWAYSAKIELPNNREIYIIGSTCCKEDSLFTVKYTQEVSGQIDGSSYRLFPNPMKSTASLQFSNPEAKPHSLYLYDASGRMVSSFNEITTQSLEIKRDGLADGVYLFKLLEGKNLKANGHLVIQ